MNSPFTDFTGQNFEIAIQSNWSLNNELLKSPFLEIALVGDESDERHYDEVLEQDIDQFYNEEIESSLAKYYPETEELTERQKRKASEENDKYMLFPLNWGNYLDSILPKLGITHQFKDGITYYLMNKESFAEHVDAYQRTNHIRTKPPGMFGLKTWSQMQNDLNWLNIKTKTILSDKQIERAAKQNGRNAKKVMDDGIKWGDLKSDIFKHFSTVNITKYNLPLYISGKYFALAVAKWQEINTMPVTGILDQDTWHRMFSILAPGNPSFILKTIDEEPGKFADLIYHQQKDLEAGIQQALVNIKDCIKEELELTDDSMKIGIGQTFIDTIVSLLPKEMSSKITVPGAILNGVIKIALDYYKSQKDYAAKKAVAASKMTLSDLIFSLFHPLDPTFKDFVEKEISHKITEIKETYSGKDEAKKIKLEYDYLRTYLGNLKKKIDDKDFLRKIAISNLINAVAKVRLIVNCNNAYPNPLNKWTHLFGGWTKKEINYAKEDSTLNIEFTRLLPNEKGYWIWELGSNEEKIMKGIWNCMHNYNYDLKELSVEKNVYFRVNLDGGFDDITPYEVFVKTLAPTEGTWNEYYNVQLEGKGKNIISFRSVIGWITPTVRIPPINLGVHEKNTSNEPYLKIITFIVNRVMEREYNKKLNSKNISYIEHEIEFPDDSPESFVNKFESIPGTEQYDNYLNSEDYTDYESEADDDHGTLSEDQFQDNSDERLELDGTMKELEGDKSYNEEAETSTFSEVLANAANVFLTLSSKKQGQIKGSVTLKGKEGSIAVYKVHHEITSPRDAASGAATGKRIHKPLAITKEIDIASVKLMNALVSNEILKQVVINFWKPSSSGRDVNYYRITLTDSVIANISHSLLGIFNSPGKQNPVLEKVEFFYQKIEWNYLADSPGTASDDWKAANELGFHEELEEAEWDEPQYQIKSENESIETEDNYLANEQEENSYEKGVNYEFDGETEDQEEGIDNYTITPMQRELLLGEIPTVDFQENLLDNAMPLYNKIRDFFNNTHFKTTKRFLELLLSKKPSINALTDELFFSKHPERIRRDGKPARLKRSEKALVQEWLGKRMFVMGILDSLNGRGINIAKLSAEQVFEDIQRFKISWIDSNKGALDKFERITNKATKDDLEKLNGITPEFLAAVQEQFTDLVIDVVGDIPVIQMLAIPVKIASKLAAIKKTYDDRIEEYKKLKNQNIRIEYIITATALLSNLNTDLNTNYRERAELFIPWMKRDHFVRIMFNKKYDIAKRVSNTSNDILFQKVCERWARLFNGTLRIVINKDMKVISLKLENVPFDDQIISAMKSSPGGLNLEAFKINRLTIFYPYRLEENNSGYGSDNKNDLYYEFTKNSFDIISGNSELRNWQRGTHFAMADSYGFQKALELSKSLPTYYA